MRWSSLFLALLFSYCLHATTWRVVQDGSGHFVDIQSAIDASAHSDSIKVYPGIYRENIDFDGKNIFIYSMEFTTGISAYRDSTILDGNDSGSVVKSIVATQNCGLYGFTIQNGRGDLLVPAFGTDMETGGGILVMSGAHFSVSACTIKNNQAYHGGGMFVNWSQVYLSNCEITQNFSVIGGGIYIVSDSQVHFDPVARSSVYNNIAGSANDIAAINTGLDVEIFLDMGTVNYHNSYYIKYINSIHSSSYTGELLGVDIQRGYLTEINADLYVSPQGSNNNDGLSATSPLKSIFKALQLVYSDSLNPKIIHLAPGEYSSEDDQFFPLGLKSHVKVQGAGIGETNLVNNSYVGTIYGFRVNDVEADGFSISLSNNPNAYTVISFGRVVNGKLSNIYIGEYDSPGCAGIFFGSSSDYYANSTIENLTLYGNTSGVRSGLFCNVGNLDIEGLTIESNTLTLSGHPSPSTLLYFMCNRLTMKNSKIINNTVLPIDTHIMSVGFYGDEVTRELKLDNVLISNNVTGGAQTAFIAAFNDNPAIINNCTFANNSGAYYAFQLNGNIEINNSIFHNNTQAEIRSSGASSDLRFRNNYIRNYPLTTNFQGISNISVEGVMLTENPGFRSTIVTDPLSYMLGNSSACRDQGNAEGLVIPDTDLAGNPRIYGLAIDLGCYEWNYPVGIENNLIPETIQLNTYPNPFTEQLTLFFDLKQQGDLRCDFYNIKGQLVRSLTNAHYFGGEHLLVWDACDNAGNKLGSGIYFMKMSLNSQTIATRKHILIR